MPFAGIAIGNFLENLNRDRAQVKDQGGYDFFVHKTFGKYAQWDKNFWTKEGLNSFLKTAQKNFLDPGDLFGVFDKKGRSFADEALDPLGIFGGNIFGSSKNNKKRKEMKKYKSELVGDKFDERQQGYLDQLLRTLGTLGAQQNNRATEFAARNDLPEGSAAALQRGVDYQTLLAGREGSVDLSRQADLQRQKNIQFLMALQAEKDADKRREMMAQWQSASNILGTIGQIAGSYYGSKTAKTTGG